MKKITLYSDGSSLGNPGFGGWCAILKYQNQSKIIKGAEKETTNNRMELKAVIEGIKALKQECDIEIVSDSKYVCEGINSWLKNWILKDFKGKKNTDLWREYVELSKKHQIKAIWVKGHNGHPENEECDRIAREEANNLKINKSQKKTKTNLKIESTLESKAKSTLNAKRESKIKSKEKSTLESKIHTTNNLKSQKKPKISTTQQENKDIDILQKKIQYKFRDQTLLQQALTHKSFNKTNNNERLEFLGDAVLDLLIGEYVFHKLQNSNEGDLTKLRASMVNETSFAKLANAIELGKYLFISQSEAKNKGRNKPSILSDAFEALIGAIYLDSELENARKITYALLESVYKEINLNSLFMDYKTALQELTQAIYSVIPQYELINSSGPDHNKKFTMQVIINDKSYAKAKGKSKKEAEQMCAKKAYYMIKDNKEAQ